jgi:hypothetical protein
MPTTRPGFIWSGTEWIAIGQEAVVNPFYYQATAPTGAATGAIWIESDVDVPSIDSAQFLRWRKTMTGGETSLSGNDDSSLPLKYTPGYEQLYINGVLQVRGGDYTATTGTTVTGLTALVANDVVEIFSAVARTVADVYTQTQSDARFVPFTGLVSATSVQSAAVNNPSGVAFAASSGTDPTVTLTTGTKALVIVTSRIFAVGNYNFVGYRVSGATTVAANDVNAISATSSNNQFSGTFLQTGLTPGSNTFTMQYRCNVSASGSYDMRQLTVLALP